MIAEHLDPERFQLALHQMGRGDLSLALDARPAGEWVQARFETDDIAVKDAQYYDSVALYSGTGVQMELIALEKRRPLIAGGYTRVRVRLGT